MIGIKEKCKDFKDFKDFKVLALLIVAVVSFAVATYAMLTEGQTFVHSDSATAIKLADCIIKNHSLFPDTWAYCNGEVWLLASQLFAFLPNAFISNAVLARAVTSLLMVIFACVVMILYFNKTINSRVYLLTIPVVFVFMQNVDKFLLYEACYSGIISWVTVNLLLFTKVTEKVLFDGKLEKLSIGFLIVLQILLCIGGLRFVAESTIPLIIGFLIYVVYEEYCGTKIEKAIIKRNTLVLIAILFSAILGLIVYKNICSSHVMNNGDNILECVASLKDLFKNLRVYFQSLIGCFSFIGGAKFFSLQGISNIVGITMATILCLVVPILQGINLKNESYAVKLLFFVTIIHNLIMFVIVVTTNVINEESDERYLITSVYLIILLSCRYIYANWIKPKFAFCYIWAGLFVLATLIMVANLYSSCSGWKDRLEAQENFTDELISRGLEKGYASYWNAYNNEMYSNKKLRMGGIKVRDARAHRWNVLVDDTIFQEEDCDTFLLLTEEENENIKDRLEPTFGVPKDSFTINDVYSYDCLNYIYQNFYVYVYDHDIIREISDNILDGKLTAKDMYFNERGIRQDEGYLLYPGGLVHGPYCRIEPGKYRFKFEGENIVDASCSIYSDNNPDDYSFSITEMGDGYFIMEAKITDYIDDMQVYIINYTENENICWDKVIVERL